MSSTDIIEAGQRKEESQYKKSKKAKGNKNQTLAARLKNAASAKERAKLLRKKRKQTRQVLITPGDGKAHSKPGEPKKKLQGKSKNTNARSGGKVSRGSKGGKGGKDRKGGKGGKDRKGVNLQSLT